MENCEDDLMEKNKDIIQECDNDILKIVIDAFGEPKTTLKELSPLTLAFIGDAIYSLIIRSIIVNEGNTANNRLHDRTSKLVSAKGQAQMADVWESRGLLSEEEMTIFKRGTNAKTKSQAKNASSYIYHRATGVEALSGYLYQQYNLKRLVELIQYGLESQ